MNIARSLREHEFAHQTIRSCLELFADHGVHQLADEAAAQMAAIELARSLRRG
jgi:hypothetical protein